MNTGIASLDSLNEKWGVSQMAPLVAGISTDDEVAARYGLAGIYKLLIPTAADINAILRDYDENPYVDYAELNEAFEVQ
jgi:hypothetical protein